MGTPDTNDMSWEYTHAPVLYTASNPDKRAFAEVLRDHPKPVSTYSGILPGQRQYANGNVPPWHKRFGVVVLNTILYTVQYTKGRLASVGLRHSRHSSYRQDTAISRQLERQATSTSITPPMFRTTSGYTIPDTLPTLFFHASSGNSPITTKSVQGTVPSPSPSPAVRYSPTVTVPGTYPDSPSHTQAHTPSPSLLLAVAPVTPVPAVVLSPSPL